jgi:hypothetical protein
VIPAEDLIFIVLLSGSVAILIRAIIDDWPTDE